MKLREYLKEKHPGLTNSVMRRALEAGACKINGKIERFATRVINPSQDKIEYQNIKTESKGKLTITDDRIVFEDEHLLIYNKEPGHPALDTEGNKQTHLFGELVKHLGKRVGIDPSLAGSDDDKQGYRKILDTKKIWLQPAHRLDKNTSGLIIFAKSQEALSRLSNMFQEKEIKKTYEAMIDGLPSRSGNLKKSGRIENHIEVAKKTKSFQEMRVYKGPREKIKTYKHKLAITNFEIISEKTTAEATHIKLRPETGRTHQLRVHMSNLGHPIVGDTLYAKNFRCKALVTRHLLHAAKLEFKHPMTGNGVKVFASLPDDFKL